MKQQRKQFTSFSASVAGMALISGALLFSGCQQNPSAESVKDNFSQIDVPDGFKIEKVVRGLNFPTAVTWDEQGKMYIVEAGGGFLPEPSPARILQIEQDKTTELVNLTVKGVTAPVVGLTFYNGNFYITHRATDLTGAVSRISNDGLTITEILKGFMDSGSEHPLNDIRVGPDGRMYLAVGPAGNSAVMGPDVAPFISLSPALHTNTAKDLVLLGKNFKSEDFRTKDNLTDSVLTGAYVPFGTETKPGQVIKGTKKPGGAIVSFDPNNAEGTLQTHAFGLRNVIGLTWCKDGAMFAAVNGYDVRGSRPVRDLYDATYRITKGTWYGWPDFSAALEPLTDPKFDVEDMLQGQIFINGQPQGKNLGFVIDHQASGLMVPNKNLVAGLHPFHSSPSLLDTAPESWGDFADQLFVAEWGDLTPPTDPLILRTGYRIARIDTKTKQVVSFISNKGSKPGSEIGAAGNALERPFDVKFGPDGAMYIVDYGQVKIAPERKEQGREPYEYVAGTGVVWKVSKIK